MPGPDGTFCRHAMQHYSGHRAYPMPPKEQKNRAADGGRRRKRARLADAIQNRLRRSRRPARGHPCSAYAHARQASYSGIENRCGGGHTGVRLRGGGTELATQTTSMKARQVWPERMFRRFHYIRLHNIGGTTHCRFEYCECVPNLHALRGQTSHRCEPGSLVGKPSGATSKTTRNYFIFVLLGAVSLSADKPAS